MSAHTITGTPWIDLTVWAVTAAAVFALVVAATWGEQR